MDIMTTTKQNKNHPKIKVANVSCLIQRQEGKIKKDHTKEKKKKDHTF